MGIQKQLIWIADLCLLFLLCSFFGNQTTYLVFCFLQNRLMHEAQAIFLNCTSWPYQHSTCFPFVLHTHYLRTVQGQQTETLSSVEVRVLAEMQQSDTEQRAQLFFLFFLFFFLSVHETGNNSQTRLKLRHKMYAWRTLDDWNIALFQTLSFSYLNVTLIRD